MEFRESEKSSGKTKCAFVDTTAFDAKCVLFYRKRSVLCLPTNKQANTLTLSLYMTITADTNQLI